MIKNLSKCLNSFKYQVFFNKLNISLIHENNHQLLAVFIKSEMLREVRENCFSKYQRYPIIIIIIIENQKKTINNDRQKT